MKPTAKREINYAAIAALIFSAFCWLTLYAVYADFAQSGIDLLGRPGFFRSAEGLVLIGLHAFGLLLLWGLALGAVATLARLALHPASDSHRMSGTPR
ncbi:MAG TPA: hypothetical protein VF959_08690 [Casimicrobiaceae bacterium]